MATFSYIPSCLRPIPGIEPRSGSIELTTPREIQEPEVVGDSAAMKRLRLQIRRIGPYFRTVLISGEAGTGKKSVARALHRMSIGAGGPFIEVASGNRIDYLIKMAQGGTLFFRGIGKMPLETQDELLETLRKNEWSQDGLAASQKMNTRIVASTNEDLRARTSSGQFRHELYQRIAMVQIALPPLRERMEDVPALATHFLDRFAQRFRKDTRIANDAMELLKSHGWPGNVKELETMLEEAVLRSGEGIIGTRDLAIHAALSEGDPAASSLENAGSTARLQDVVDRHVLQVLGHCAGNKLRAAELLGISRSTLYRMLDACSSSAVLAHTE